MEGWSEVKAAGAASCCSIKLALPDHVNENFQIIKNATIENPYMAMKMF
jgi:hypothetical protein